MRADGEKDLGTGFRPSCWAWNSSSLETKMLAKVMEFFFLLPSTFMKLCFTGRNPQRDPQRNPECSTFERDKDRVFSWPSTSINAGLRNQSLDLKYC